MSGGNGVQFSLPITSGIPRWYTTGNKSGEHQVPSLEEMGILLAEITV
jgi:hypothetical protein